MEAWRQRRHGYRHLWLQPLRPVCGSDGKGPVLAQYSDEQDPQSVSGARSD